MKYSITILALIIVFIGFIQTTLTVVDKEPIYEITPNGHSEIILESNNIERKAFLYVPKFLQDKSKKDPIPLVIALHGFGSTAGKNNQRYGMVSEG